MCRQWILADWQSSRIRDLMMHLSGRVIMSMDLLKCLPPVCNNADDPRSSPSSYACAQTQRCRFRNKNCPDESREKHTMKKRTRLKWETSRSTSQIHFTSQIRVFLYESNWQDETRMSHDIDRLLCEERRKIAFPSSRREEVWMEESTRSSRKWKSLNRKNESH